MNKSRSSMSAMGTACLIFLSAATLRAHPAAGEKSLSLGLRCGPFAPLGQFVQGMHMVTYDEGGSPTNLYITGFGPGGEIQLHADLNSGNTGAWVMELGGRLQRRESNMSLAPDGEWDRYDHEMTAATASLFRMNYFPLSSTDVVPYLGLGVTAQLIRWETLHEPEGGSRDWTRGESVVPGLQVSAGWKTPIYYELFLDTQIRYSYCMGKIRIRNEDTATETEYQRLNLGGFSVLLGLSLNLKPHD